MKLTTKVNPITVGNNHFEGGELSIELTPTEALSIGSQLKDLGDTINNSELINKIPMFIEMIGGNKSNEIQTLQNQIAELTTRLNEAVCMFASFAGIRLDEYGHPTTQQGPGFGQYINSVPNQPSRYYTPPTPQQMPYQPAPTTQGQPEQCPQEGLTDFREEEKAPEAEKPVVSKSLSEIEAARKRNEREILSNLWDTIKSNVHGDSTCGETRDKITWGNMEIKFDRTFPKISIKVEAPDDSITLQSILVNVYADQSGARPNKIKISDINSNIDLYEHGYNLGFYQRKVMALINGMYEEQLKK